MKKVKFKKVKGKYICIENFTYNSKRYNKYIVVHKGYPSDGATGAKDINSNGWWVHDILSEYNRFSDGSHCSILQSSWVLHDILKEEDRCIRAKTWFVATFVGRHVLSWWNKITG